MTGQEITAGRWTVISTVGLDLVRSPYFILRQLHRVSDKVYPLPPRQLNVCLDF
jgi:hypothetical protein